MTDKTREKIADIREELADLIGEGVHTGLRKWCESKESHAAWIAITNMPDPEWSDLADEVAGVLLEETRVAGIPLLELLEKAKSGVLVELAEDQSWPRDPFYPIKNYNQLCENIGFRRVKVKG